MAFLRDLTCAADAVCGLCDMRQDAVVGTAFLIGPQYVLTAFHVVDPNDRSSEQSSHSSGGMGSRLDKTQLLVEFCKNYSCWFRYETRAKPPQPFQIRISQVLSSHKLMPHLDVLILKLEKAPPAEIKPIQFLYRDPIKLSDPGHTKHRCFIVGHPRLLDDDLARLTYKQISMQRDNFIYQVDEAAGMAKYFTDTAPGNSGSPVFVLVNGTLRLFAVHHTGVRELVEGKRYIGYNQGTLIATIIENCKEIMDEIVK